MGMFHLSFEMMMKIYGHIFRGVFNAGSCIKEWKNRKWNG